MRLSIILTFASCALASNWFSKAIYNKWHETELERWLSDHNIPYPAPADRKDLETLVKDNWNQNVVTPYQSWNVDQLNEYLKAKGVQVQKATSSNKDALIESVKKNWYETESSAEDSYSNVKDWIFDTWGESQLKKYLDKNGIPAPQPRTRDSYIAAARKNYETASKKAGQVSAYPGNWLYDSWSDSDLKAWLDERGYTVPQPSNRDKLIAAVRRNSRLASLKLQDLQASAAATAQNAKDTVNDAIFDAWSDSQLKKWADENGIKVPQGSTRNEVLAIVRRNKAKYLGQDATAKASSAWGAATTRAGNEYAKATDTASGYSAQVFDQVTSSWSDSRLKAYLDARGVPVPQNGKRDELLAKVRLHRHKAASGYSAWTFDTWTAENLRKWLEGQGQKASTNAKASRDELLVSAQSHYDATKASATSAGSDAYASVTSALAKATATVKDATFDTWSDSELKSYLDSYGVDTYQGSTRNELIAKARRNAHLFRYGSTGPTVAERAQGALNWVYNQVMIGIGRGAGYAETATDAAKEKATVVKNRAYEAGQTAAHKAKEEL